MNDKQRRALFARLHKKGVLINRPNPHGTNDINPERRLDALVHSPRLVVDSEHTVAKIQNIKIPFDYSPVDKNYDLDRMKNITRKNRVTGKEDNMVFSVGDLVSRSHITENEIAKIAHDAKLQGYLKTATVKELFDKSKIYYHNSPNKPVVFVLGNTTYFVSPYVQH